MKGVRIEVLHVEGCPNLKEALAAVEDVLAKLDLEDVEVARVPVTSLEEAARLAFPGSPTVRVNGRDVYASKGAPSLAPRRYAGAFGWQGWPPRDFIQETIETFL